MHFVSKLCSVLIFLRRVIALCVTNVQRSGELLNVVDVESSQVIVRTGHWIIGPELHFAQTGWPAQ